MLNQLDEVDIQSSYYFLYPSNEPVPLEKESIPVRSVILTQDKKLKVIIKKIVPQNNILYNKNEHIKENNEMVIMKISEDKREPEKEIEKKEYIVNMQVKKDDDQKIYNKTEELEVQNFNNEKCTNVDKSSDILNPIVPVQLIDHKIQTNSFDKGKVLLQKQIV